MPDTFYSELAYIHARQEFWQRGEFINPKSPIGNFISAFPSNYYSQSIINNYLPYYQVNKSPYSDVPDFPYWGSGLIKDPLRIAIVADSNLGKGTLVSNTLYAMLWSENVRYALPQLNACFNYWDFSRYSRYAAIILDLWELSPERMFVTDAFKCGKASAAERKRSQKVLFQEMDLVEPSYVITLGADSFRCISGIQKLPLNTVKVDLGGRRATVIASPFPAGMGVTSANFPARLAQATWFIWRDLHGWGTNEISRKLIGKSKLLKNLFPGTVDKVITALREMKG